MKTKALSKRLSALALDLRWSWCPTTQAVFAAIDPLQWEATQHAPHETLRRVPAARLEACADDESFVALLEAAEAASADYYAAETWFDRKVAPRAPGLKVAYFCSEFAIHESMQ